MTGKPVVSNPPEAGTAAVARATAGKLYIKTQGCQMNVYDSARWPTCWRPSTAWN